MGFSTNSLQVESVTPEKAAEFLKANYAKNRKLRPSWVSYLAREMHEGRFMSTAEIHIMYRNGEPSMVNGQHTCSAIIAYGKPVRVTVRKTYTTEAGQIAMAYAFGHDNGIRRTFSDGMNAYNLTEQTGLPSDALNRVAGAIRFMRMGFNQENASGVKDSLAEMVNLVLAFVPTFKMFNAFTMPCERNLLKRLRIRSVLSVGLLTFYYQPDKAGDFWSQVSRPDVLPWNDARVTARRYIETDNVAEHLAEGALSRKIARCWKAFNEDEPLRNTTRTDPSSMISIFGTEYTGRQGKSFLPSSLSLMNVD